MATKKAEGRKPATEKVVELALLEGMLVKAFEAGRTSIRYFNHPGNAVEEFKTKGLPLILEMSVVDVPPALDIDDAARTCSTCANMPADSVECRIDHKPKEPNHTCEYHTIPPAKEPRRSAAAYARS